MCMCVCVTALLSFFPPPHMKCVCVLCCVVLCLFLCRVVAVFSFCFRVEVLPPHFLSQCFPPPLVCLMASMYLKTGVHWPCAGDDVGHRALRRPPFPPLFPLPPLFFLCVVCLPLSSSPFGWVGCAPNKTPSFTATRLCSSAACITHRRALTHALARCSAPVRLLFQ